MAAKIAKLFNPHKYISIKYTNPHRIFSQEPSIPHKFLFRCVFPGLIAYMRNVIFEAFLKFNISSHVRAAYYSPVSIVDSSIANRILCYVSANITCWANPTKLVRKRI